MPLETGGVGCAAGGGADFGAGCGAGGAADFGAGCGAGGAADFGAGCGAGAAAAFGGDEPWCPVGWFEIWLPAGESTNQAAPKAITP